MKNPNELSATSSWRGNELQLIEQKANIVVGVANSRTRLRIGVLLSKYSEYQVDYISSESETGKLIEEADPPYALKELETIPELIFQNNLLKEGGLLVLEHGKDNNFEENPHFFERRVYGSVNFSLFR